MNDNDAPQVVNMYRLQQHVHLIKLKGDILCSQPVSAYSPNWQKKKKKHIDFVW